MPTYPQVTAAVEIGMLARERDTAAAGQQMLRLLKRALGGEAVSLVAMDPFDGEHHQLAGLDYPEHAALSLAEVFPRTRWFDILLGSPLPQSISSEPGRSFRRGRFYNEHLRPAGFRDGMSGALWRDGRYVGLVHLSSDRDGVFNDDARRWLAAVTPALAVVADVVGQVAHAAGLGRAEYAALVRGGDVVEVPECALPPMLDDPGFREVVAEFAESAGRRLCCYWPVSRAWYRVTLTVSETPASRPALVLVRAHPAPLPYGLTSRELDVLTWLAMGATNDLIAQELVLSPRTVHTHVLHLLRKTRAATRTEAAALAVREGIVRPVPGLPCRMGISRFVSHH